MTNFSKNKKIFKIDKKVFSRRLAILLKKNGMSQKDLADRLGLSQPAVHKYLNNKSFPDLKIIFQISSLFGVPVEWLFIEEDAEDGWTDEKQIEKDLTYDDLIERAFVYLNQIQKLNEKEEFAVKEFIREIFLNSQKRKVFMELWQVVKNHFPEEQ